MGALAISEGEKRLIRWHLYVETFLSSTKPVEDFYRSSNRLREIDAKGPEKDIFGRILRAIVWSQKG